MAAATCDRTLLVSLSTLQRNVMLAVFGMNGTDRTHMAEISIESSLREIVQAEDETKLQLQRLIEVVRKRDVTRQRVQLKADLVKSSNLRKSLCALQQKRMGMEQQMEKLRESKLNMHMLQSMQHTNIALQNLGFKISDADTIMMDLEEAHADAQTMQNSLSSTFADEDDLSEYGLEEELALMLSDDALMATHTGKTRPSARPAVVEPHVELHMPAAAPAGQKPPDEPPSGAESAAESAAEAPRAEAAQDAVQTEAVAPKSTMYGAKKKKARARAEPESDSAALEAALEAAPEAAA